jgi:hypothetical protein
MQLLNQAICTGSVKNNQSPKYHRQKLVNQFFRRLEDRKRRWEETGILSFYFKVSLPITMRMVLFQLAGD